MLQNARCIPKLAVYLRINETMWECLAEIGDSAHRYRVADHDDVVGVGCRGSRLGLVVFGRIGLGFFAFQKIIAFKGTGVGNEDATDDGYQNNQCANGYGNQMGLNPFA